MQNIKVRYSTQETRPKGRISNPQGKTLMEDPQTIKQKSRKDLQSTRKNPNGRSFKPENKTQGRISNPRGKTLMGDLQTKQLPKDTSREKSPKCKTKYQIHVGRSPQKHKTKL